MKLTRGLLSLALSLSLSIFSFLALPVQHVSAQDASVSIQRGYRTGYSDGYMAGYRDTIDGLAREYTRHKDYTKADRAYNKDFGTVEDYRDGYRQGFESGYSTGFEKRSFEPAIPSQLKFRGTVAAAAPQPETVSEPIAEVPVAEAPIPDAEPAADQVAEATAPAYDATDEPAPAAVDEAAPAPEQPQQTLNQLISFRPQSDAIIIIPKETELVIEIIDELSTEKNNEGDKFMARVVSPTEIAGAVIEGRIAKIAKPGRIKKRSEMLLSFDRIVLSESRWANFNAVLTEVMPVRGDNVRSVDAEGTAVGKSSVKRDSITVGGATGTGAVIGAVAGGPVGAAVGAGVGAAFGVGAVVIERGKHIHLNPSQQLRIKTAYETQIR